MRSEMCGVLVVWLAGLVLSTSAAFGGVTFTRMPLIQGQQGAFGSRLSTDGSTVVGHFNYAVDGRLTTAGFRWRPEQSAVPELLMPGPRQGWLAASAVSGDGRVVGGWNQGGSFVQLRDQHVRLGTWFHYARDMSDAGDVVVGEVVFPQIAAFISIGGERAQRLNLVPGADFEGAKGVSGDGRVIVGWSDGAFGPNGSFARVAVMKGRGGAGRALPSLPQTQMYSNDSTAMATNYKGTVVVGTSQLEAARWLVGAGPGGSDVVQSLGVLPGMEKAEATDVSDDGRFVVGSSSSFDWNAQAFTYRPFLWQEGVGIRDLNLVLPELGVDLSGWTLQSADGISGDGRTLLVNGIYNGEYRSAVVTGLPAPGAVGLLVVGGAWAVRRRRQGRLPLQPRLDQVGMGAG